jgi:hypothetical protein
MVTLPSASSSQRQLLERSRRTTIAALRQVDNSTLLQLSRLTLPEIQQLREEIAQILPAGNLPAFVLSGLVQLKGRRVSAEQVQRDVSALLRGINLLPQGLYGVFIAGPATVLYAYQKILRLAGKDLESAFPHGTWQFYLQFGLREDTARHANETVGFHRQLPPQPDPVAMAAAWVCAAMETLYSYDDLIEVDWTERVCLRLLAEEAEAAELDQQSPFDTLARDWNAARPYHRPPDGSDYVAHRRWTFEDFLQERLDRLPDAARERFQRRHQERRAEELPRYQRQMTLLAALEPDRHYEHKTPIPIRHAAVAFVRQGHTYLLGACHKDAQGSPLCYPPGAAAPLPLYALPDGTLCDAERRPLVTDRRGGVWYPAQAGEGEPGRRLGSLRPPPPEVIRGQLAAIFSRSEAQPPSSLDLLLAESPRALQPQLRAELPAETQEELAALRRAPIVLNWDARPHELPLAYIRRTRRGIGDHALTILRTERSVVFDQSHIFFDGLWGLTIAEIMTDGAVHWYRRLVERPPAQACPPALQLSGHPKVEAMAREETQQGEAAAESHAIDTARLSRLRKGLRQRGVRLTVNDLLLLYRHLHAAEYRPSPDAQQALEAFRDRATTPEARAAWQSVETTLARLRDTNPALLIPMDAGHVAPRERIFPTTFRNPLTDIQDKLTAARKWREVHRSDPNRWEPFDEARRELLAYLKAFGDLLNAVKGVTTRGESFNTATIRLLAHLPPSMQHLLDQVPQRIGVLNEIVKGNEVFSNLGRVAPGTSIVRFISAKDDGATKELVWGVVTDDAGRMHISLRDFRPYVPQLVALGERALADLLAQDYLESYTRGFNRFVDDLSAIITTQA